MENINKFDIELPYGFTTTMYRYNSSESNYPNYNDFAYDDKVLLGAVTLNPLDLTYSICISANVVLSKHKVVHQFTGGRNSLTSYDLDSGVIETVYGNSIKDIIDKFISIRNNIVLENMYFIYTYINAHAIQIIESVIQQANADQVDAIMDMLTKESEVNGEYIAMCLRRKLELGFDNPEMELLL